jgi:DNA (cytosine-5)-methyltransferase 1
VQRSAYEIQMRAVPAATRMEQRGFKLDVEAHKRLIAELEQERITAEREYREACLASGHTALANQAPSTPAQKAGLLTALLTSDELARWRRTEKSGALSTKRSELLRAGHYPPILALVKLSRLDKLLSSFGQTLAVLVSPVTGRIHAHYRVAGTASGRASCAGPNLQQVPHNRRFRALFIPEPGHVLIVADYSSMELRAAAYISGDCAMTEAFEQAFDLHKITASRMSGKDPGEVTDEERKGAKVVNFGGIYGQGAAGLVQSTWAQFDLVLDPIEAKAWLQAFENSYYGFAQWRRDHYRRCEGQRYIVIGKDADRGMGRIFPQSRVPEGASYYTRCCNLPVQGACADASMLALAYVDDRLEAGIEGGPVAWLHDEIVLEVREDQAERAAEILKQAMIDGFAETFPGAPLNGLVEPQIGPNWGEAKGKRTAAPGALHQRPEPDFTLVVPDVGGTSPKPGRSSARSSLTDGARPTEVTMSHSPPPIAMGTSLVEAPADIGGCRPAGFPEASAAMTFFEFFCGGGMARAGLPQGWKCSFANDIDPKKGAAYAANWGGDGLVVGDVANLKPSDLPGVADLAWASPPCVGASLAGGRKGLGPEAWVFLQRVQDLRAEGRAPKLITIENVPATLTSLGEKDFDRICDALTDTGYLYGVVVIDAALFVPQSRERLFIVAVDGALGIPISIIAPSPSLPFHTEGVVKALRRQKAQPIWWRLPVSPPHDLTLADILDDRGVIWDTPAKTAEILDMMDEPHLERLDGDKLACRLMVRSLNWRTRGLVTRWESRDDLVANCLRTASGGSSIQRLLFVDGPSVRTRKISPREYARAMGLPDSYKAPADRTAAYNLIGDGVAVPVVRFLAQHIFEPVLQASTAARRAIA